MSVRTNVPGTAVCVFNAMTPARRHQAVTSFSAAVARATVPMGVSDNRLSSRMRARTGKAVTPMATPVNKANTVGVTPVSDRKG